MPHHFKDGSVFSSELESLSEIKIDQNIDISSFLCEDGDLNDFIWHDAYPSFQEKLSVTYLLLRDQEVVGFYSLCNDCIMRRVLPEEDALDGRNYKAYPALKVARLARKSSCKGQGIGLELFIRVVDKANELSELSGCRFLTVDAYNNPKTLSFYEDLGFKSVKKENSQSHTINMYLDFIHACNSP